MTHVAIKKMIDEAIANVKKNVAATTGRIKNLAAAASENVNQLDEKFCRTLVVGSFGQDTAKEDIVNFLTTSILKGVVGIEETYAYTYGSVGFVRFETRDAMYVFLKDFERKEKPHINGKKIWVSVSKTPEERKKGTYLSKFKRMLIETNLEEADNIKIDYKRGIVFVDRKRVAEWTASVDGDKLVINKAKMEAAGIQVDLAKMYDAVEELVQE